MDDALCMNLIDAAQKAMPHSYAPYSNLTVGAAGLWDSGQIYSGCNIENASYGLTICAERCAIFKAVSEGAKVLKAIAVISSRSEIIRPCGACLQVMLEFCNDPDEMLIIAASLEKSYDVYHLSDYLPRAFR